MRIDVNRSAKPATMSGVKDNLRALLAESHVPVVTIAVLLLWSFDWMFQGIWQPSWRIAEYVATAVAILGIPSSGSFDFADEVMLFVSASYLFSACFALVAAWILARWVYRETPFRVLSRYGARILRTLYAQPM